MAGDVFRFSLDYAAPFDWAFILRYLQGRASAGVEWVDDDRYFRTIGFGEAAGTSRSSIRPRSIGSSSRFVAI